MSMVGFKAQNHRQQTAKRGADDKTDDRGTKWDYIHSLEARPGWGPFDLDVAAAPHNAKAPKFYTREDDGLTQPWRIADVAGEYNVWCNPPYSDCGAWVRKAWDEWNGPYPPHLIAMLLPANRPEQNWWQEHVEPFRDRPASPLRVEFLKGRMRFDMPPEWEKPEKGDRPPFGCALLIWKATWPPIDLRSRPTPAPTPEADQ